MPVGIWLTSTAPSHILNGVTFDPLIDRGFLDAPLSFVDTMIPVFLQQLTGHTYEQTLTKTEWWAWAGQKPLLWKIVSGGGSGGGAERVTAKTPDWGKTLQTEGTAGGTAQVGKSPCRRRKALGQSSGDRDMPHMDPEETHTFHLPWPGGRKASVPGVPQAQASK